MEDIDDDFGDLYADVELRVSSSVNAIQQSITELVRAKDEISGEEEEKNVDSVADCGAKEVLNSEVNGEEAVSLDSGSDSEEDLNIVLNDDGGGGGGCRFAVGLRNGGYEDEEVEVEEETGGPVGGLEGNALGKNQKWRNQPQGQVADELDPSLDGRERGNGGHNSQYPQYKFIRSHRVEFSNNSNANGSVVLDFNTSASIKGDMEDIGFGQRMGHQLMGAQNRQNFSLPRARTILDVNIDSFEWKPWRHPVADVTDFFNFGFNEDSWKTYCNHLDQYRQQTRMLSRVPAYGFLNSKETCEAGYGCEAQEALDELVAQTGHETEISSALGTSSRTHKQLEMPIGRPIQVEDSNGERQPSMDVRRPLDRDSVVIQIAMLDLKEDSSGSAKVELGCVGSPVQELPDIGDSADDAREISCFSGASEDELSLEELEGHDEGMSSPVTKRCTEETTACRLSTNSDAHGIAQISGIDVLDPRKVTVYDSEGTSEAMETSNITKRRVVRSTSDTAISILETESCHGEQSQQIPSSSYSGSHGQAIDNDTSFDQEKYGNLGKESSPNLVGKLDRYDSHDSKNSRSGRAKRKSSHCNYSTTHRSPIPELAKHWKDKDASPMSDIDGFMGVHHQTVLHGKQKERLNNFDSYYQEDTCDYRESKRSFNHYGGRFCDYKTDGYTRNPHSKQYQKFVTESNQYCNRDWDEGEYFIERRKGRGSHEEIERDWYQHERQLPVHGMRAFSRNNSSWLTSNHDSHVESGRGNRWRGREDELRLRDRMRNDNYSRNDDYLAEYSDDDGYIQDRFERPVPYNDTGTDYSDHGYGSYSPYGRREIKSPGISNRRFDIPSPELDNMWDRDDVYQSLRCRDHRSLSSHSYKEVATADNQRWRRSISPRNVHERHISHREHIWNDGWRDGGSAAAFDTQKRVNYPDELPLGRRHHFTNDVFTSRSRDDKFFDHGTSYDYESTSRCKSFDDRHGGTLMGDKQLVHGRCKLIREENDGNRKDRRSNIISRTNHELTKPRGSNSVDSFSVNGEGKLAGRLSISFNDLEEETTLKGSDETRTSNLEVKSSQQIEAAATDIEEGQIIVTEETNAKVVNKNTSLLEAMARMEKRRERFKEPILTKKDSDKTDKPVVVETCVETAEAKQQRPARKRRWGGN